MFLSIAYYIMYCGASMADKFPMAKANTGVFFQCPLGLLKDFFLVYFSSPMHARKEADNGNLVSTLPELITNYIKTLYL